MQRFIDENPARNRDDFVAAIGELIAAILDRRDGIALRHITAIDIGDARHGSCWLRSGLLTHPGSEMSALTTCSPPFGRSPLAGSAIGRSPATRSTLKTPSDLSLRWSA